MKRVSELLAAYVAVDVLLENERSTTTDESARMRIELRQRLNDHAYFLLCWGQLETEIDDTCRAAIRKRSGNPDWTKRRAWDLYNPDDKRLSGLSFEERAKLVIDFNSIGREWQLAMKWYGLRNLIAHGGSHEQRIDLTSVVSEFFVIHASLSN